MLFWDWLSKIAKEICSSKKI